MRRNEEKIRKIKWHLQNKSKKPQVNNCLRSTNQVFPTNRQLILTLKSLTIQTSKKDDYL